MIAGIEHTAIASPDPARLAGFYVDVLGFTINYRGSSAVFVKAPDGTMIEIIRAEGEAGAATPKTPGLRHIALRVTGFEAELAKLRAAGVTLEGEPVIKGGNQVVFFRDPEGNLLHFIERETPLP
jgi:glyoxylase I family protein